MWMVLYEIMMVVEVVILGVVIMTVCGVSYGLRVQFIYM